MHFQEPMSIFAAHLVSGGLYISDPCSLGNLQPHLSWRHVAPPPERPKSSRTNRRDGATARGKYTVTTVTDPRLLYWLREQYIYDVSPPGSSVPENCNFLTGCTGILPLWWVLLLAWAIVIAAAESCCCWFTWCSLPRWCNRFPWLAACDPMSHVQ